MRYYFDLSNLFHAADPFGIELPSIEQAVQEGLKQVEEIRQDCLTLFGHDMEMSLSIRDESGRRLFQLLLSVLPAEGPSTEGHSLIADQKSPRTTLNQEGL